MLFDPAYTWHSNTVDNIQNGLSWEGACDHAGKDFEERGIIQSGWYCEKNNPATSIWLNYKPEQDWWFVSSNKAQGTKDMCEYQIADKGVSWCSNPVMERQVCGRAGQMYLICPGLIYYEWVYKGGWGFPYRYEQKKHPDQKMSCSSGVIDTQECLEPPLTALASFEDQQHDVCVSGHNIKSIDSQSPETCAQACLDHGDSCLGIEYRYTDGRCTLANGDNTAGCNGSYYKIDWYKRATGREDASLLELGDERAFVKTE
jgi:hypothetical protein